MSQVTKRTPKERATQALESRHEMCSLLADCRQHSVPGWWDGSAFRNHPVGMIVGTVKLTNHWHTSNACDIKITDGEGWDRRVSQDSFGYGNPHPEASAGSAVTVWESGRWMSDEFREALEARVLEILTNAAAHIEKACIQKQEEAQAKAARAHEERAAVTLNAIAKARGENV